MFLRAGNLLRFQAAQPDMGGVVHDMLELLHRFEAGRHVLVGNLLGSRNPRQRVLEVTLPAVALTGGLCQIQVTAVVQVRPLVEVPLIAAREEALFLPAVLGTVALLREPVLLADDAVLGQYPGGLYPGGVHGLILFRRHRVQLGKLHLEGHGQVGVLAHDAAVLHREQGNLRSSVSAFNTFLMIVVFSFCK